MYETDYLSSVKFNRECRQAAFRYCLNFNIRHILFYMCYTPEKENGGLILSNYITSAFKQLLQKNELREIRFSHPKTYLCNAHADEWY